MAMTVPASSSQQPAAGTAPSAASQQQQAPPPPQGGAMVVAQQQQNPAPQQPRPPQQQPSETPPAPQQQPQPQPLQQPRFEDLTIDDDLPLLPRLQRYVQSSIALQRLVHVRLLGEVALEIGQQLTATELVPLLPPLVKDGESIIRQRLCGELKVICLVLMGMTTGMTKEPPPSPLSSNQPPLVGQGIGTSLPQIPKPNKSSKYYKVMVHHIFPHLYSLISDPDNEVRRAASENIVKLALRVDESDVVTLALSIPLRLVKEGQKRASNVGGTSSATSGESSEGASSKDATTNPQTPAEDLLITSSNLLADLSSFLPPPRLPPEVTTRYLSPTILSLADDPNFRVRRAAVQALPRMLGSATLDDVKRRLLPKFVALSGDEMYRVRKASGECLVDVSRALGVLPWRIHFGDVWITGNNNDNNNENATPNTSNTANSNKYYKPRTKAQISALHATLSECTEIRRRALCAIAKKLLEDTNKFVRYGMMQFLGPLIASFYPLDRGSMVGAMGGLLYGNYDGENSAGSSTSGGGGGSTNVGTLGIGVQSVDIAKGSTGLERIPLPPRPHSFSTHSTSSHSIASIMTMEHIQSYNHSLSGLELILHGESPLNYEVLPFGGGCNATKDPFGTMGPQFFPHANGMVGRSSALDDDDTDSFLLKAFLKRRNTSAGMGMGMGVGGEPQQSAAATQSPRALLPKFLLESRSDALALARIVHHRSARIPHTNTSSSTTSTAASPQIVLPYPPLMSGRPDPEDLKLIRTTLLIPFIAMASCRTGEDTTDAEMRVYCAYSLPAVILLFGGNNWEKDGLKRCFLDLIGLNSKRGGSASEKSGEGEQAEGGGAVGPDGNPVNPAAGGAGAAAANNNNNPGPPLPVKRCLASSVHAVAHMLGPEIVSRDAQFLSAFERSFLRDPDEAIRLNVLKNLASFLGALPPGDGAGRRNGYLQALNSVIMGEDVLGAAKKRSASNPGVLNWRQRDAVARVLPDLMVLFDAERNREYLWPALKTLLTDSVSAVRENAGWSVPVLLRRYCCARRNSNGNSDREAWIAEVTVWLRETFLDEGPRNSNGTAMTNNRLGSSRRLKKQMTSSEGAFSKRQGYCRILAAVALATRMGEEYNDMDQDQGVEALSSNAGGGMPSVPIDPFGKMSPLEREQFRTILLRDLLPPALAMAIDCVANVRLTLTKCLKVLPEDIRRESHVEEVLGTLEEELMTWDVGDMPLNDANPGGILGGPSTALVAGSASSSDPPEAMKAGGGAVAGITMTSTMSAC